VTPIAAGTDFEFEKCCQFFVSIDSETPSVVMPSNTEIPSVGAIAPASPSLEQAEQFEHYYDNDNYSDYIEDASVHALD
jgi:hypothetical protein